jgi:hypothetical protein
MMKAMVNPMLKHTSILIFTTCATLTSAAGCGKVDATPPATPSSTATATASAPATAGAPQEKTYSFDLEKGFELGNARNVVFAFGKGHGPFADVRRAIQAAKCQPDYRSDAPPDDDRQILESNVVGLPSQEFAMVTKLSFTMTLDPTAPRLGEGACYGVRGRDGRWTWHVREQKMEYNAATRVYTGQFDIREPGPIDAVKLVTFASSAMHITNITYTVALAP